jgi:hypothetical protein
MFDSKEALTVDEREQRLIAAEETIARLRAIQLEDLAALDTAQVATGDGCKSLSEWVAARLDVSLDTARSLVRTMRRTAGRSDLRQALASGTVSFDRVEAVSKITDQAGLLLHLDVAGVAREAARRARVTAEDETRSLEDSYLVLQPSLDESWWQGHFGLDGYLGSIVDKALSERADQLPALPDGTRGSSSWRKAMALADVCMGEDAPANQLTVFVDATQAAETSGQSGVILEAGPKVGRRVLEGILCDSDVEVIARTEDGEYMNYGRRYRTATPAQKRALLDRYAGRCAADGCDSRYRLEAHHSTSWTQGGETNLDEMVLLCWFHHHVVVHRRGFMIYTHPETGRIRFRAPKIQPEYEPSI